MPRVLKIDSLTNKRICKSAGAGGFSGSSVTNKCHNKARIGLSGQCFECKLPFQVVNRPHIVKMVFNCNSCNRALRSGCYTCGRTMRRCNYAPPCPNGQERDALTGECP